MAGDPSIIDGTSDQTVIETWKALVFHPFDHKWTITQIVASIIFATTVAYLWNYVLKDILEIEKLVS